MNIMNLEEKNLENTPEDISETISEEKGKKKREKKEKKEKKPHLFSRIKGFFKRKTEPAREFMRSGRAAAMIAEVVLGGLFSFWMVKGYTYGAIPKALCFLIIAAIIVIISELLNLILKIVFGAGKRCKPYFFIVAFFVSFSAIGATQMNGFLFPYGCSFLLTLAVDVLARALCGFVRTKRFKQVFAYVAIPLSLAYIGLFAYYFFNDNFGKSRVDF